MLYYCDGAQCIVPVDKETFNPMNLSIFVSFLNKPLPITVRSSWSYKHTKNQNVHNEKET